MWACRENYQPWAGHLTLLPSSRTLYRAPPPQSQRLGKGQSPPNLSKPHGTPFLLLLIISFITQNPPNFLGRGRKKKFSLTSCTALPQQSPLRPTKKEDKLSMFICQFYFPPICFSLVCKPRNGERRWDADTFFSAAASELVLLSSRLTVVCDPHNDQTCTAPW